MPNQTSDTNPVKIVSLPSSKLKTPFSKALLAWTICGIGALFYFYEYLLRVAPSVVTNELMLTYHISAAALGNLTAFYYYIYSPMQLPVGILMDRYGARRLLTMAGAACAIGTFLFAYTHFLWVAQIGRFLTGFGSAFAFVGVLKLATIWLPPQRFAMIAGLTTTLGQIGGIVGVITLTALVNHAGWQSTFYLMAYIGVGLTILMYAVLKDHNPMHKHLKEKQLITTKSILIGLLDLVKNKQIWLNGMIGCLLYIPTSAFAELWGIPYLKIAYHLTDMQAARVISMIFLGWAVGGPLIGLFSDRIAERRLPLTVGAAVAAVLLAAVFYVPDLPPLVIGGLLFTFGFFSSAEVVVFAIGRENSTNQTAGTAIALTNMLVMVGGVIFQPLIGIILDHFWNGQIVNGIRIYSLSAYQIALAVLPLGLLAAVFLTFFLQETRGRISSN